MKTLVTGANGLLGANIVRELLSRGHEVRAMVRRASDLTSLRHLDVELFFGDIRDEGFIKYAVRGCDYIIHAAARSPENMTRFQDFAEINIKGTQHITWAAEDYGISRMVHVSSCCVYSGGTRQRPGTELSEYNGFRFNSGYINSKYISQQWILSEVEKKGFPVVIVNPTIMIGPYDRNHLSVKTILELINRRVQLCPPGGKNFVDVRDVAKATCNALTMGIPGECYLLGSENLSFSELFKKVGRIAGHKSLQIKVPGGIIKGAGLIGNLVQAIMHRSLKINLVNCRQFTADSYFESGKAIRHLGLEQRPVDEAIRDAIEWYNVTGIIEAEWGPKGYLHAA